MRCLAPLLAAAICCVSLPALAQEAPFGLRWGATIEELKIRGVTGDVVLDDGSIRTVQARSVSGAPADTGSVRLIVHRQYGLQRIVWQSRDLSDDPSGNKALTAYQKLKASMTDLYGPTKSAEEELPSGLAAVPAGFFLCLAEDGCAAIVSVWRTADVDVRVRLVGTTTGTGWLEAIYLGPDWSDVTQDMKRRGAR